MTFALALALLAAPATPGCDRADLLPATQKVDERVLLDAACGKECVLDCDAAPKSEGGEAPEEPPPHLFSHYEGSFRCPGRLESVVSLFPCGEGAGIHGIAGTVVLMQGKRPPGRAKRGAGWEQAGTIENTVLNGECKVARAGDRDALVCLSFWGPLQGVTGQSLCVVRWSRQFEMECAPSLEDNCGRGEDDSQAADVQSWNLGAAAADGTLPVRLTVKVGDCEGKKVRTVEGTARIDREGVHFDPETQDRFQKLRLLSE